MVGKNIKRFRKLKRLSQIDLAKILNISDSTLSSYERDTRKPSIEMLQEIANVLEVTVIDIQRENPNNKSNPKASGRLTAHDAMTRATYSLDHNSLCQDELNRIYKLIDQEVNRESYCLKVNIISKYQDYILIKLLEDGFDYAVSGVCTTIKWNRG